MKKQETINIFHPLVVTRVDRHIGGGRKGSLLVLFHPFFQAAANGRRALFHPLVVGYTPRIGGRVSLFHLFSKQQRREGKKRRALFFIHLLLWAGFLFFISFPSNKQSLFHPLVVAKAVGLPRIDGWDLSFLIRGSLLWWQGIGDWCHQFLLWLQLFSFIKYIIFWRK